MDSLNAISLPPVAKPVGPGRPAVAHWINRLQPVQPAMPQLSWRGAAILLAIWTVLAAGAVAITLSPLASGYADKPSRGPGDIGLYRAEIRRMHAGESYYAVAADELRSRGYPTASVFNWRTPLQLTLIAALPDPDWGRGILVGLAGLTTIAAMLLVGRNGTASQAIVAGVLLVGAQLPCALGDIFVMPELWAGTLIALSACSLGLGWTAIGMAAGVAAMFCRDLAASYAALALVIALAQGKRLQASVWTLGIASYLVFFAWHAYQVAQWQQPDDIAHAQSWLQLGGAAFVISTVQTNAYLLLSPQWVSALFLMVAIVGYAGWATPSGQWASLTATAYLAMFAAVGHSFNQYWGVLIAPLLAIGAAMGPATLVRLWHCAQRSGAEGSLGSADSELAH